MPGFSKVPCPLPDEPVVLEGRRGQLVHHLRSDVGGVSLERGLQLVARLDVSDYRTAIPEHVATRRKDRTFLTSLRERRRLPLALAFTAVAGDFLATQRYGVLVVQGSELRRGARLVGQRPFRS